MCMYVYTHTPSVDKEAHGPCDSDGELVSGRVWQEEKQKRTEMKRSIILNDTVVC